MIKLNDLIELEDNPRKITSKNKRVLKESIEKNIKFLEYKPILVDENNVIIAGNQRWAVLKEMGYEEVPDAYVKRCVGLTEAERKDLIVIDNINRFYCNSNRCFLHLFFYKSGQKIVAV